MNKFNSEIFDIVKIEIDVNEMKDISDSIDNMMNVINRLDELDELNVGCIEENNILELNMDLDSLINESNRKINNDVNYDFSRETLLKKNDNGFVELKVKHLIEG